MLHNLMREHANGLDQMPANEITRRDLLRAGVAGLSAISLGTMLPHTLPSASAAEPVTRNGKPHMKLSLAAYSFSRVLPRSWTPDQLADAKYSLEKFIDFCAEHDCDGCELTAYYFPKTITNDYLMSLKERTFRLGLDISGTAIVNFDGGNFRTDDPYRDLAKIAPYAINAQIKVEVAPNGKAEPTDLPRAVKILKDANYRGFLVLEYEAKEDPLTTIPGHLKRLRELID